MKDMNAGVEAFRAKLLALVQKYWTLYRNPTSWKNIVSPLDKFTALWIPYLWI